ncbi:MAG: ATP-binding protein [Patescibacteria group bacterium]
MPKIDKKSLQEIAVEQRAQLAVDGGVERAALTVVKKYFSLPQAVIVAGIRRCGKSTLLRQVMSLLKDDYYYFNFEDERLIHFRAEQFNDLYEVLLELYGRRNIFFFDEIQNVVGWERFVRRFQDNRFKFFITGSNASLLSRELGTRLTGRYVDCTLYPFSFAEFLRWKNFEFLKKDLVKTTIRAELKKYFNEYFALGGMPEYLRFGSDEALKKVYESIIYRDIITRYELKDERALRELCVYLFSNLAVPFSYTALKETLRLGSVNTVKSYIQYLENSFLFFTVNKFNFSYRKQIISPKKAYCIDNALAKALGFSFSENKGRFLENIVFLELKRRGYEPTYYLSAKGQEIDFVVRPDAKKFELLQVCWSLENRHTKAREIAALQTAMADFKISVGYILTDDEDEEIKVDGKKIIVMSVYKWLLV